MAAAAAAPAASGATPGAPAAAAAGAIPAATAIVYDWERGVEFSVSAKDNLRHLVVPHKHVEGESRQGCTTLGTFVFDDDFQLSKDGRAHRRPMMACVLKEIQKLAALCADPKNHSKHLHDDLKRMSIVLMTL